jgi:pimeloyl-ACP methyl ester carboxylesterase
MVPSAKYRYLAAFLAGALLLSGCASGRTVNERMLINLYASQRQKPKTHPVIFIPGMMGSVLQDSRTGKTVWGNVGGTVMDLLALPIDAVNLVGNRDSLSPSGLLGKFTWIPGVVEKKVYQHLTQVSITAGGYTPNKDAFSLSYDWRRDLVESAQKLGALIEEIKAKTGNPDIKVDLLCHSSGGLIARYYAKYGTEDVLDKDPLPAPTYAGARNINKIIMLGTPHAGAMETLQRLHEGLWLPTIVRLTPEVIFTMPAMYQLLPCGEQAYFIDRNGNPLSVDIFDAQKWHEYGWSVFAPEYQARIQTRYHSRHGRQEGEKMYKAYLEKQIFFLSAALQRARQFQRAVWNGDLDEERSKITYVALGSDCQRTLKAAQLFRHPQRGWRLKFTTKHRYLYEKMFGYGDKSVTKESLLGVHLHRDAQGELRAKRLPVYYSGFVCESHSDLTASPTFMDNVLNILLESSD